MNLWELKAEIAGAKADVVEESLLELGDASWALLEDLPSRRAWVVGIFEGESQACERWRELKEILAPASPGEPVLRLLPASEWRDSYKAHFKAWSFGRLRWVPIWERPGYRADEGVAVLWLDPGMAFGTGNHEP